VRRDARQELIFFKLRKFAFKVIHSTTILLPAWYKTLEDLKLRPRIMLRDVATRWNSTFDMLEFALKYRAAIDKLSGTREMGLRQFELSKEEWVITEQLRDALQVSTT
jgi:hypothetical protein